MAESEETQLAERESLDNFDRAFSHIRTGCFKCECGKVYWDNQNGGYDWGDGELEALEKNPNATAVPYAIDVIDIDGLGTSCGGRQVAALGMRLKTACHSPTESLMLD